MKSIRLAAFAAALVLAPIGLAACGGSDNSQDQDDITAAIDRAATSGDPAACTDSQTQKFNEQTSGGGGGDATKQCEKDAADSASDSVDVSNIEVDGDTATAEAALTGGFIDGQTVNVSLVKEGDQWKLDQLTGFADFDREAFTKSALAEIAKDPTTPAQAVACIKAQFDKASEQQLEDVVIGNGGDQIFGPCFQGQ
jgi:hypothetical protein